MPTELMPIRVPQIRCLEESLPQSIVGKEMLDILENVGELNRRQAYGFIGKMEDWIEVLPIQKPMKYSDNEQRDAPLLIVLDLMTDLSWSEYRD